MHIRAICSSLSTAFSVWSYANDAIRQMENEMVLLRGLINSGCMFSGFPPSSGSLRSVYITAIVRQLFESIDPSPCPWRAWSHCGDILPNQLQFGRGRELLLYSSWLSLEIGVLLRASPQKNALVLLPLEPRFHFLTLTLLKKESPVSIVPFSPSYPPPPTWKLLFSCQVFLSLFLTIASHFTEGSPVQPPVQLPLTCIMWGSIPFFFSCLIIQRTRVTLHLLMEIHEE